MIKPIMLYALFINLQLNVVSKGELRIKHYTKITGQKDSEALAPLMLLLTCLLSRTPALATQDTDRAFKARTASEGRAT